MLAPVVVVLVADPVTEAETVTEPDLVTLTDAAVLETETVAGLLLLTVLLETIELVDGLGAVAARSVAL